MGPLSNRRAPLHNNRNAWNGFYQTRQAGPRTMGWPVVQAKAFWNSGMLDTTPLTRKSPGEWGSV